MDGMVGQHRNEQVRADTGVRAMPDWAQAEFRLKLPEGVFKVSQSPVRAENLFCIPIGVRGSKLHIWAFERTKCLHYKGMNT